MIFIKYIILTGMSGAGKSTALKFLEDLGYFCVDNLPPSLIPKFIELCNTPNSNIKKIAFCIDIRGRHLFTELFEHLNKLKIQNIRFEILFLDASDEAILKRFKESRRNHPLSNEKRLVYGIDKERNLLKDIKKNANYIIDTTYLLTRDLKQKINEIFVLNKNFNSLIINILSFGFKYGVPKDADLVFDVRFIPNPYYIPKLKYLTGNDKEVQDYVMKYKESSIFLNKLKEMLDFLIPNYVKEGKNQLVIAIGCTGGKHRSVTLANNLFNYLKISDSNILINHRDIDKILNK